jgi:hypothetical protein
MVRQRDDPLRRRGSWLRVVLFVTVAFGTAFLFRQGLVIPALNPLVIDLARPGQWLVDWRLAGIKHHPDVCARTLRAPQIEATPIPDSEIKDGCGWTNAVRLVSAGGIRSGFDKVTCETAVALALWLAHDVQTLAQDILGEPVTSIQSFGSYSCRNIVGNRLWSSVRSQHASANAVDIAGFWLKSGRSISVLRHWHGDSKEASFLRAVHSRACAYFRVALSPDYNAAHHNHFHFDRGPFSRCK